MTCPPRLGTNDLLPDMRQSLSSGNVYLVPLEAGGGGVETVRRDAGHITLQCTAWSIKTLTLSSLSPRCLNDICRSFLYRYPLLLLLLLSVQGRILLFIATLQALS